MNQYVFLQRIQGPAMLLTFGVCALLDQWGMLNFGRSWPLYLIVLGIIKLAQRAALATAEPPPLSAWIRICRIPASWRRSGCACICTGSSRQRDQLNERVNERFWGQEVSYGSRTSTLQSA